LGRVKELLTSTQPKEADLLFDLDTMTTMPEWDQLVLEGYYFPPLWRRFVWSRNGRSYVSLSHPCGAILHLRVAFAPQSAGLPGFIGLECYTQYAVVSPADSSKDEQPWFALSGPTGNKRTNGDGHIAADGLYCIYPADRMPEGRSVDYLPDYIMSEVPTDGLDHSGATAADTGGRV